MSRALDRLILQLQKQEQGRETVARNVQKGIFGDVSGMWGLSKDTELPLSTP